MVDFRAVAAGCAHPGTRPVVFAGPTITAADIRAMVPDAVVVPPVAREHLHQARAAGFAIFLVLDGTFSHGFAVSPREVVDVVQDGALVLGASSMGAIRAAECWPAGMVGVGVVFRLYRHGILTTDDEVAVATDADRDHEAISCALVNVRFAVRRAVAAGLIDRSTEEAAVAAARRMHFSQRTWPAILRRTGIKGDYQGIAEFCRSVDVKREDALRALRRLGRVPDQVKDEVAARTAGPVLTPPVRYPGHHRYFDASAEAARADLVAWLFGSGRYQRYVWPLVIGEPEFANLPEDPQERPDALRASLAEVLARLLRAGGTLERRIWHELEFLDELDAELARWYATRRLARSGPPNAAVLRRVREEVAVAHGAPNWHTLTRHVDDGRIFGAIPMAWVTQACDAMARARAARLRNDQDA
ncbi:hypothetical protein GCM10010191_19940 [Actinomadura vinacea]|uniref:TfuA-like core domain-containing protein n=1 Tax=Actinomadura vinacea TaxID=115336 RepID=A0ABN3IPX4_9ACTN